MHAETSFHRSRVGCVLLAGGERNASLRREWGFSPLEVPLRDGTTALDRWVDVANELSDTTPLMLGGGDPRSLDGLEREWIGVENVTDSGEYRGPAGVVRDALRRLPHHIETVAIIEAMRWFGGSLRHVLHEHLTNNRDATVLRNPDGSSSGVIVASRSALETVVPERGFFDLKEQWLARVVDVGGEVGVSSLDRDATVSLHSRSGLLDALRIAHGLPHATDTLDAARNPGVFEVEAGGFVGVGAHLEDTIVLSGARVGAGAVVARSVIGRGGVVQDGGVVTDRVVRAYAASKTGGRGSREE